MLHDPARHEALAGARWDAGSARRAIEAIVQDTEARYDRDTGWPLHPHDGASGNRNPSFDLYGGALGVVWALRYLEGRDVVELRRSYREDVEALRAQNRQRLSDEKVASYLEGDTGSLLLGFWLSPSAAKADELDELIARNLDHPARELMLGAPGTMLAALFLHERSGEARWAERYVQSARTLWSQLEWSADFGCSYWTQHLAGSRCTYLGGIHGFAATAAVIIRGRHLLDASEWDAWQRTIVDTMRSTTRREGDRINWPAFLYPENGIPYPEKHLMQICHGAPGVVTGLAHLPTDQLDFELVAAGHAIWDAGPLRKGAGLCHGTAGNGYAFLKLFERTGDEQWLNRARAFAMHAIAQMESQARRFGQLRYSLWTGDHGLAIYLCDCLRGAGRFPTLDTFLP